jgi:hypothetical protein
MLTAVLEVSMRYLKSNSAMETLEAAITTPIAVLVMLATINLGMLVYANQAVQAAARHGARMGSVAQACPACYALNGARHEIADSPMVQNPDVSILASSGVPGSLLVVQVRGNVPNYLGGFIPGLPNPFIVTARATFRQEGW